MRSEHEKDLLLKAVDGYKRRLIIVSDDYRILSSSYDEDKDDDDSIVGRFCYEFFYNCSEPCRDCIALKAIRLNKSTIRTDYTGFYHGKKERCRYSYPVMDNGVFRAAVVMDHEEPGIREMEDQLKRSNAFLHNLINSAVDGVIAADMSGKIIIFNEAAAEITGYSVAEAIENLDIRKTYAPGVAEEVMRLLRSEEYGGKGKLKGYRADGMNQEGQVMPISLNAAIVYEEEKEVATIGFFHDMREYLEMQSKLKKTQLQLLQAEKMSSLGKLAAGVAHQLNNPLGGIILFAKLILEDYDLPDGVTDDINRILRDAQRCSDTVKELLEFARQTKRELLPLDINKSISRTLFLLESQTLFHNIVIQCNYDETLPHVPADSQQLNHVLMNIILNAADAMDGAGHLTLTTGRITDEKKIFIEIKDSGSGIPEHVLPHIFEPFFTTKEEGKGTGLGLSMVYGIIENHGGTITAESTVGEGTKFRIELSY
ncbi:MAG: PAS domain S-box protein [Proteobacteria bacterium]|nr:PAS domain S-box protein [Pseudomonadota bacterium]